jgi:hypothetical protein
LAGQAAQCPLLPDDIFMVNGGFQIRKLYVVATPYRTALLPLRTLEFLSTDGRNE